MGKLKEMSVSRVDGVDKPAIRKRWVLVKSEDGTATEVEKDYAGAARAAIEAIAKEGVSFSDETVEVLRALVELLDLDVDFAAKSEDADGVEKDDEAEDDADESGDEDEVEKTSYTPAEVEDLLSKFAAAHRITLDAVAKSDGDDTPEGSAAQLRVTKSKQPKERGEERTVRKGTGLFANIVNGKPDSPYSA